ncbi:MAG: hypothetical protein LPK26_09240 [Bacillaceae bacterium]|uniref:Uncharacterized protein n=1 Tax=Alkalihalobacterium chitinilyticum TaxID=2980103 RepID=A0ABT5VKF5_9BACI|nr:hypothetical protein [Alkalihalobacterium chitinilyticum]MDE5415943.1 hypothetical protein [Alkalihalobacterium chitinilyticum]MEB1807470.1 hypothetical protein [Bacillaceae bacterium]
MPRKPKPAEEGTEEVIENLDENGDEVGRLTRLLAAVLNYLSDDDVEEIDIEYLFNHTEGLREWWDEYRESNRKIIEDDIKNSLGELSLKELESIYEKIKEKEK